MNLLKPHPLYNDITPTYRRSWSPGVYVVSVAERFSFNVPSRDEAELVRKWNAFVEQWENGGKAGSGSGYWYEESLRAKARAEKYEKLATDLQLRVNQLEKTTVAHNASIYAERDQWRQEALESRKERMTLNTLRASLQAKEEECNALRTQLNTANGLRPIFAVGDTQHSLRVKQLEDQLALAQARIQNLQVVDKPLGVPHVKVTELEKELCNLRVRFAEVTTDLEKKVKELDKLHADQLTKNQRLSSELGERATGKWTSEPRELYTGDWLCDFGGWFDVVRVHEGPRGMKGHTDVRHMKIRRAAQLLK